MIAQYPFESSWERAIRAVERVRERLDQSVRVLEIAGIPYVVVGGNAVAYWVSRVDEGATRNTPDVDILIERSDLEAAKSAIVSAGFVHAEIGGEHRFDDGSNSKLSCGIRLRFAGEYLRTGDPVPVPTLAESVRTVSMRVVSLEALVRMKLVAWRLKDRVHLQDMTRVGLLDDTWPAKYPPPLDDRLRDILANPDA